MIGLSHRRRLRGTLPTGDLMRVGSAELIRSVSVKRCEAGDRERCGCCGCIAVDTHKGDVPKGA